MPPPPQAMGTPGTGCEGGALASWLWSGIKSCRLRRIPLAVPNLGPCPATVTATEE